MTVAVTFTETVRVAGATYTVDDSPYDLPDNLAARFIHRGWATGTISGTVSVTMSAAYKSGGVSYAQGETYEIAQPLAGFLISEGKATPATGPDVAPTYAATGTINTNDGVAEGAVFATDIPTNSPSPAELVSVEIDGGSDDFEVEAVGASIRWKRKAGSNWTALIGNPPTLQVNWIHAGGTGSFTRTINVSDASSAVLLQTLKLVKTDANQVDAGAIPDMLGLGFKKGDVPSGNNIDIKIGGVSVDYSIAVGKTTWSDGSTKRLSVLLRTPANITGASGTEIDVEVYSNGGSPVASSSRAQSDLTAAALNLLISGVTNLTGDWETDTLASSAEVLEYGDGVGKVLRVGAPFKQSGSDHGQLHSWWYFQILEDASGGLYGIRYLPRVMQIWCDVASPTPTYRQFTGSLRTGTSEIVALSAHSGTGSTANPVSTVTMPHYTAFHVPGSNNKYRFIAGTRAAEPALRWKHDREYWVTTRLLPPWDLSISPTAQSAQSYLAYFKGPLQEWSHGTGGERDEIGHIPSYHARHFFCNDANGEQTARFTGLIPSNWRINLRRASTKRVPVGNHGPDKAGGSYSGLGPSSRTLQWSGSAAVGVQAPAETLSNWAAEYSTDHRPNLAYWPFLFTGEPQFLDILEEYALQGTLSKIGSSTPGTFNEAPIIAGEQMFNTNDRNITINGKTYYMVSSLNGGNLCRVSAWALLALNQLLACLPDTDPGGTAINQYVEDICADSFDCINEYNENFIGSFADTGIHMFRSGGNPSEGTWTHGYLLGTAAASYGMTERPGALTFTNHLLSFYKNFAARSTSFAQAYSFAVRNREGNNGARIETFDGILTVVSGLTITADPDTDTYTITAGEWVPTNGDRFGLNQNYSPPLPNDDVAYFDIWYVGNVSGNSFQIFYDEARTELVDITNGTTISNTKQIFLDPMVFNRAAYSGHNANDNYLARITSAINWAVAVGATEYGDAVTKAAAQVASAGLSWTSDPTYKVLSSFPA